MTAAGLRGRSFPFAKLFTNLVEQRSNADEYQGKGFPLRWGTNRLPLVPRTLPAFPFGLARSVYYDMPRFVKLCWVLFLYRWTGGEDSCGKARIKSAVYSIV